MIRLASILTLVFCASALGVNITEPVKSGDIWKKPITATMTGMRYTTPDEEHVRTKGLTLGPLTTGEVIITHKKNTPESMQVMLYNKGDDGVIDQEQFESTLKDAKAAIDELTGAKARFNGAGRRNSAVKVKSWEWKWDNGFIRLEANSSGKRKDFEAEFIRLNLAADADILGGGGAADSISRRELRDSITTEEDGTVWLKGVPMVDQGEKGYCVPATLARIFAFYGMDKVDQHALADVCDSKAGGGTTSRDMEEAMKQICKKFRTKFIVLEDYVTTFKSALKLYNREAKKADKDQMTMQQDFFGTADPAVLREARAGKKAQVNKWLKGIKKHIDSGSPVIWMVMLGIYQEDIPVPQARGGHGRLIIGYNLKEQTIIYTDSWGSMHARKTMPAEEALSMTTGRYVIRLR